jgi:uncharacterized RDD family membrane protein YckC
MEFEIEYDLRANTWRRLANLLIDLAVQYCLGMLVGVICALLTYINVYGPYLFVANMNRLEQYLLGSVIAFVYYFTFESLTGGRTIGKYITNTKVLTWYGSRPSAGVIAKRSLCRLIPFEAFSFLTESPRGWHDSLSNTVVVDIKKYNEALYLKRSFEELGEAAE